MEAMKRVLELDGFTTFHKGLDVDGFPVTWVRSCESPAVQALMEPDGDSCSLVCYDAESYEVFKQYEGLVRVFDWYTSEGATRFFWHILSSDPQVV